MKKKIIIIVVAIILVIAAVFGGINLKMELDLRNTHIYRQIGPIPKTVEDRAIELAKKINPQGNWEVYEKSLLKTDEDVLGSERLFLLCGDTKYYAIIDYQKESITLKKNMFTEALCDYFYYDIQIYEGEWQAGRLNENDENPIFFADKSNGSSKHVRIDTNSKGKIIAQKDLPATPKGAGVNKTAN